jgi:hypothetical protein
VKCLILSLSHFFLFKRSRSFSNITEAGETTFEDDIPETVSVGVKKSGKMQEIQLMRDSLFKKTKDQSKELIKTEGMDALDLFLAIDQLVDDMHVKAGQLRAKAGSSLEEQAEYALAQVMVLEVTAKLHERYFKTLDRTEIKEAKRDLEKAEAKVVQAKLDLEKAEAVAELGIPGSEAFKV